MSREQLLLAVACVMIGCGVAQAGPLDPPKPEVYLRAEDQERARLLSKPCSTADVGHGCYRFGNHAQREQPCTYHIGTDAIGSLPTDQCYKMDKPRRFRGVWIDEFEGQAFIPEGTKAPEWPRDLNSRSPRWQEQFNRAQAATIWLDVERAKVKHEFGAGGRKMVIDFVGRKTTYPGSYGHMGMSGNEIIVDRVISLKKVKQ